MKSVAEEELTKEQLDETEVGEIGETFSQFKRFKMFVQRLGKELLFLFVISCTTYATLINIQNDYDVKVPDPKPFFNSNSCVTDFYTGDLTSVLNIVDMVDLAVVFFYAPWDADSIHSKEAFIEACEINKDEVYFAAVNCWQPYSVCNKMTKGNKVYPIIVAYDYTKGGIYYTGPTNDAAYITRFIDTMKRPVMLLNNKRELLKVHQQYHAVLVASVDFDITLGWELYKIVLDVALNYLKTDPLQIYIKWCVATWPLRPKEPLIKLLLWNRTVPFNVPYVNRKSLEEWIVEESQLTTQWIPPIARVRTSVLETTFETGPTMLLFTPHNPYMDFNPVYSMLQLLSIEYFTCQKDSIPTKYISNFLKKEINSFYNERPKYVKKCYEIIMNKYPDKMANILKKQNSTIKGENKEDFDEYINYLSRAMRKMSSNILFDQRQRECSDCDGDMSGLINVKANLTNLASTEKFIEHWDDTKCYRAILADKYYRFSKPNFEFFYDTLQSLKSVCASNKSITFVALDSIRHYHTAKVFGINLNDYRDKTAVLIYDMKSEMVHALPKSSHVTKDTMAKLLVDFIENRAARHYRSLDDHDINFHLYRGDRNGTATVTIETLNINNFKDVVFNNTQNVVVYFYTPTCSYCQTSGHVVLNVAHLMQNVKDLIFVRFNGKDNDLSWHLSIPTYPTVIIFPAKKKSESYAFPYNNELTFKNLSKFILSHLVLETRLQAMIGLCSSWDSSEDYNKQLQNCLRDIKLDCDASISKTLQSYRRGLAHRELNKNISLVPIFNRLKYLKAFSLALDVTYKLNAKSMQKFSDLYSLYLR